MVAELDRQTGDFEKCCHAGVALLLFALDWLRRRKPASAPDWFTAHPVPLSGFTSPNSRPMPPRRGRGVTGPPRPKSRLPSVASGRPLPEPRGPDNGRCSNAPLPLLVRMHPAIRRDAKPSGAAFAHSAEAVTEPGAEGIGVDPACRRGIFRGWRQLSDAIAAPSTNALKQSSWYRIRVTRSARSAGLRWSRGGTAPTFPHSNLSNVQIEGRQPKRTLLSKIDSRFNQIPGVQSSGDGAAPLMFVQGARETISRCRRGHFYHPAKCYYAMRPREIPRPKCTTRSKRLQKKGGEDAFVHHVRIVFPFRREGTCQ